MDTHTLKKCDLIISLVKKYSARYLMQTQKFGIECPKTLEDTFYFDKQSGNSMRENAIVKEMKNVQVAYNAIEDGAQAPT